MGGVAIVLLISHRTFEPTPLSNTAQFPVPKVQFVDGIGSGPVVFSKPSKANWE